MVTMYSVTPMRAFILAGGFATRLWPLTEERAKPLLPLAGRPMISHLTAQIPAHIPITVSTNAAFEADFNQWKQEQERPDITIEVEETTHDDQKLGALGATAQWIKNKNIGEDILLLTGDNYCGFSIKDFVAHARPSVALLAAHDVGDPNMAKQFGTVILNDDGRQIAAFEEKPPEPKTTLVSTGCSVLPAEVLSVVLEYAAEHPDNVGGIFEELLRRKYAIDCYRFEEPWFDVGSFGAYLAATKTLVGTDNLMAESAQADNSTLKGSVIIGANSRVVNCELRNVVVFDNCVLEDCILEDCVIDNGCELRGIDLREKMIRRDTKLMKNEK